MDHAERLQQLAAGRARKQHRVIGVDVGHTGGQPGHQPTDSRTQRHLGNVWEAEEQGNRVIHPDTAHASDRGHLAMASRTFEAITTRCSGAAYRATAELEEPYEEVLRALERRRLLKSRG